MVHYFKLAGTRLVLDEASGYTAAVDEITYKMLAYLTLPLPDDCPSAIRYDMAKYDSALVGKTYHEILELHKTGKLYTDVPFDADRPVTTLVCGSEMPLTAPDVLTAPIVLRDTDNRQNALKICEAAKEKGLFVTVCMTKGGDYPCDRLLVAPADYAAYKNAAPTVGIRFSYDGNKPDILGRVTAFADEGIVLMDAYPENPETARAGEQTALIKELGRVAKELYLRKKEGRPVEFLPFALQGRNAKHGPDAFAGEACASCSHRTHCGGYARSEAECEIKKACANAAILMELDS